MGDEVGWRNAQTVLLPEPHRGPPAASRTPGSLSHGDLPSSKGGQNPIETPVEPGRPMRASSCH